MAGGVVARGGLSDIEIGALEEAETVTAGGCSGGVGSRGLRILV